jgi:hypothetical protein
LDSLIKQKSPAFLQDFNSMIYMLFTFHTIVLLGPKNQELKLLYEQESVFILFSKL